MKRISAKILFTIFAAVLFAGCSSNMCDIVIYLPDKELDYIDDIWLYEGGVNGRYIGDEVANPVQAENINVRDVRERYIGERIESRAIQETNGAPFLLTICCTRKNYQDISAQLNDGDERGNMIFYLVDILDEVDGKAADNRYVTFSFDKYQVRKYAIRIADQYIIKMKCRLVEKMPSLKGAYTLVFEVQPMP